MIITFKDLFTTFNEYSNNETLQNVCTSLNITFTANEICEKLFDKIINNYLSYVVYCSDEIIEVTDALKRQFIVRLLNIYDKTYYYYEALINGYEGAKNELMSDLKTTSTSKTFFNDTPQNANTEIENNAFVSNYTKSENETVTPVDTKIKRLNDIINSELKIWQKWINEFRRLFIEKENIILWITK